VRSQTLQLNWKVSVFSYLFSPIWYSRKIKQGFFLIKKSLKIIFAWNKLWYIIKGYVSRPFGRFLARHQKHLQKLKMKKRSTASNSQVCKDGAKSKINYEMFFLFRPFLLIKTLSLEMLSLNSFQLKLFYRIV